MAVKFPVHITVKDLPYSKAVEDKIQAKIEKLNGCCGRITHFDVHINAYQKRHHQGKEYSVRIDLGVPGEHIHINKIKDEDVYVAIRDAFNATKRKLDYYNRRIRNRVKTHEIPLHGKVIRISPEEGFGFIAANGKEFYFQRSNVVYSTFEKLKIGSKVQFLESHGSEGLQANRVSTGKHGKVEEPIK